MSRHMTIAALAAHAAGGPPKGMKPVRGLMLVRPEGVPESLRPLAPGEVPRLPYLLRAVAYETNIPVWRLLDVTRDHKVVKARQIYYWLGRRLTSRSTTQIAVVCGRRDHSPVIHGIRRLEANPAAYEPFLSRLAARFGLGEVSAS